MKVAAAHLDDRAEAAVVGAAARGLDDVDLPAEQRVAVEHARGAIGQLQPFVSSRITGRSGLCTKPVRRRYERPADRV